MLPSIGAETIGLLTLKSPIFDSLGQPAPSGELGVSSFSYWVFVQTPRPAPTEGLMLTPSGSVTTAFRTGVEAQPAAKKVPCTQTGTVTPLVSTLMSKL